MRELITHYTAISTLYVIVLDHILLRAGALCVLLLPVQPVELFVPYQAFNIYFYKLKYIRIPFKALQILTPVKSSPIPDSRDLQTLQACHPDHLNRQSLFILFLVLCTCHINPCPPYFCMCWSLLRACSVMSDSYWTAAHQATLSMEFSRQEYWSGLPFPSPRGLHNPGVEPESLESPATSVHALPLHHLGMRWLFSLKTPFFLALSHSSFTAKLK